MHKHTRLVLLGLAFAVAACSLRRGATSPALIDAAQTHDALAIADALEHLIEAGTDTLADREYAYEQIRSAETDSAAAAFARASIAGRVVQAKGLLATPLIVEAETYARRSRELDPNFRDGAATRMLGTLYVVAPARLLQHGDSEAGLDLLEELTEKHPDVMENQLRLAEAYIMLHDPDPARPHLCVAQAAQARLRRDDQLLLQRLVKEVGVLDCH